MSKAVVRKDKKNHNSYNVSLNLTQGELLSLREALKAKAENRLSEGSPHIAHDLDCYIGNALTTAGINF